MDAAVVDYTTLLKKAMEVVTTLYEHPNLQRLNSEVHELQQQHDEMRAIACNASIAQCLAKL